MHQDPKITPNPPLPFNYLGVFGRMCLRAKYPLIQLYLKEEKKKISLMVTQLPLSSASE